MTAPAGLRPGVVAAKARLASGRDKLRQRHARGTPGVQVCRALTDLVDGLVLDLYRAALEDLGEAGLGGLDQAVAIVAHGGYGRRDLAPYSDVDLMILHPAGSQQRVAPLAQRLMRDIFDTGLILGQSVRTIDQACGLARQDPVICTSLIESRLLAGQEALYDRFTRRYRQEAARRADRWLAAIQDARAQERAQYGETVYLLEPNIKRSRGGLRDIQLLRWVGFVRYGACDPDGLRLCGALDRDDHDLIQQAQEFLLRLRNELHFYSGKANDVLDRAEQVRIAEQFGYRGQAALLPVEQFMREYFRHTTGASSVVTRLLARAQSRPKWRELAAPLVSHQFEGDFRVGPTQIMANRRGLAKMRNNLEQILRLADVANLYDKRIAADTTEAIRQSAPLIPDHVSSGAAARFISLLSHPARLGDLLRTLHDIGILERIIPQFAHARNLLQFNEYHKFTVDEHSLLAVERATQFESDNGPLGRAYRSLKRKWLLHLALLIHDLGKGYPEDHCDAGLRIATDTAVRLHLSQQDAEVLKFLVHKHLMMSHLAFRRDTSDEQLITRLAVDVGSLEVLQMLYVLTAADLAAVGPGVLNAWKVEVLSDLYHRTRQRLSGDTQEAAHETALRVRRSELLAALGTRSRDPWFQHHLEAMPGAYLLAVATEQILADLDQLRALCPGDAVARGYYLPESRTLEFRVATSEAAAPGVFHRLTGALSGQGLQILSAEINTLYDGLVFDRFFVLDPDFAEMPPPHRIDEICRALEASLEQTADKPAFRRLWRPERQRRQAALSPLPTQVRVDNNTSDHYTILDIFAADRMGLLYAITRALFELDLSVSVAKIGTYLDQVVDVFYVTDASGKKIDDQARLQAIRRRLLDEIDALERQEAATGEPW